MRSSVRSLALALALACTCSGQAQADEREAAIFAHDHYSVICVEAEGVRFNGKKDVVHGTAFFLTEDGIAVTNSHVVPDANNYQSLRITGRVRRDTATQVQDTRVNLTLIERDAKLDLALLKSDKPVPSQHVHVQELKAPTPGTGLLIIGCPGGTGPGLNSAKVHNVRDDPLGRWMVESPMNPGMSGAPVFNSLGRVVGVATGGIAGVVAEGKPVVFPYPPGIVIPFTMVEAGLIAKRKVGVSRGNSVGKSPPLVLTQVLSVRDTFARLPGFSTGGGGGGGGGGPLASTPGSGGGGNVWGGSAKKSEKAGGSKPKPIIRSKEFTAAPGYEFLSASVIKLEASGVTVLGAPTISTDRTKLTVRYATSAERDPTDEATLNASVGAAQARISARPAQLQKMFEVQQTNLSQTDRQSETPHSLTFTPEAGYLFSAYRFIETTRSGSTEPSLQLSEDRRRLTLRFTLAGGGSSERPTSWLVGTLMTSQTLAQ